ncbi:hypothetical protein evm_014474 [Chilo suppressalis]|nr:hypothetical protein evm_014474 [Chilo suppressalis]
MWLKSDESFYRFRSAFVDEGPSKATIYRWCSEFKRGRLTSGDEQKSGRSTTAVTGESVLAVKKWDTTAVTGESVLAVKNFFKKTVELRTERFIAHSADWFR